jgi:ketosteroid isomerase-like protein
MTTEEVLDHHLGAFIAGDVDALLDDYTDESVIITPDGVARGPSELRAAFERLLSGMFAPGTYEIALEARQIDGEVAFVAWHASCADADVEFATDTFLVRDGKIAVQTFAAKVIPKPGG